MKTEIAALGLGAAALGIAAAAADGVAAYPPPRLPLLAGAGLGAAAYGFAALCARLAASLARIATGRRP